MRYRRHILGAFLVIGLSVAAAAHVKNLLLPEGCGSCHVGHGMSAEPMLALSEERFCYQCHGSDADRSKMITTGKLSEAAQPADIASVFNKPYRHPVEEGIGHSPVERLPAAGARAGTHAECVDCHNPHDKIQPGSAQVRQVSGYSITRQYLDKTVYEYQICLKCHADVTGLESPDSDLLRAFSPSVASQHPVTKPSSGSGSESLLRGAGVKTLMDCSDCHTNDDPNGPRGPHGSSYEFMLSANYQTDGVADESPFAYAFCYSCHDRQSVLNNESFPLHREHIVGDLLAGQSGTSCYTCHSAHSSRQYPHLIRFNAEVVSRNADGRLDFIQTGERSGECYLNCHGRDHSPGSYQR